MIGAIMAAFGVGLAGTIYLSLRSREVEVPDIVSKERFDGEATLRDSGLNVRVRASRYKADAKPGTILDQSPRAGEVVKVGQTIAVVLSREPKEGEGPVGRDEDEAANAESSQGTSTDADANKNNNQNRNQRNRNTNRNIPNKNANKNTANQNAGNRNANANRNANRNANVANRNTNQNTNNRNAARNIANVNRRAPTTPTPPAIPAGNRP
jgi:hypothetical protein